MTVKELIEELKKQRQNDTVVYSEAGKLIEVTEVFQIDSDLVELS